VLDGKKIDNLQINRILVIKLRAIGDVVLSTVVLKNLRNAFPNAIIDFLTEDSSRQALEGNPDINSIVVFKPRAENGFNLIRDIRKRRYDLVIDLFGNPRSALVTLFSSAKYRVGYRFGWRKYCYNIIVTPRGGEVHNTQFNLDALRAISVAVVDESPKFYIEKSDSEFADRFFNELKINDGLIIAINPAGGWYTKRWPETRYAGLADQLVEKLNAKVLILWGPGEMKHAEEIQKLMRTPSILIPSTTLKQLGAIISRCALVVTNDTGPMHIAAALGIPIVAIFGPTNPDFQGPVGTQSVIVQKKDLDCLGCNLTKCSIGNPCMEELSIEEVLRGVEVLIKKLPPPKKT
jgi:lipopolysaccharide heptosyltransferase III